MGQVVNTFWADRLSAAAGTRARRRARTYRVIDAVVLSVVLAAAAICASVYWQSGVELSAAVSRHQAMVERVEALQSEAARLEREVKQLQTDPQVIEMYARQRLGLVRGGEVVMQIEPEKASPAGMKGARAQLDRGARRGL